MTSRKTALGSDRHRVHREYSPKEVSIHDLVPSSGQEFASGARRAVMQAMTLYGIDAAITNPIILASSDRRREACLQSQRHLPRTLDSPKYLWAIQCQPAHTEVTSGQPVTKPVALQTIAYTRPSCGSNLFMMFIAIWATTLGTPCTSIGLGAACHCLGGSGTPFT